MRIRLWVGIGSWVMASSLPSTMPDDDTGWSLTPTVQAASLATDGGEAGAPPVAGNDPLLPSAAARGDVNALLVLLAEARQEYERAVADGGIREPLEYHGSRGLFLIARQAFDRMAADLRGKDPATVAALAAELDRLATAWPATELPPAPVMSPSDVTAAIARIERVASRLTGAA